MKTHKYQLIIEFESERAVKAICSNLTQYENGLCYFVEIPKVSINETFVYGTGKTKLKKIVRRNK